MGEKSGRDSEKREVTSPSKSIQTHDKHDPQSKLTTAWEGVTCGYEALFAQMNEGSQIQALGRYYNTMLAQDNVTLLPHQWTWNSLPHKCLAKIQV